MSPIITLLTSPAVLVLIRHAFLALAAIGAAHGVDTSDPSLLIASGALVVSMNLWSWITKSQPTDSTVAMLKTIANVLSSHGVALISGYLALAHYDLSQGLTITGLLIWAANVVRSWYALPALQTDGYKLPE